MTESIESKFESELKSMKQIVLNLEIYHQKLKEEIKKVDIDLFKIKEESYKTLHQILLLKCDSKIVTMIALEKDHNDGIISIIASGEKKFKIEFPSVNTDENIVQFSEISTYDGKKHGFDSNFNYTILIKIYPDKISLKSIDEIVSRLEGMVC